MRKFLLVPLIAASAFTLSACSLTQPAPPPVTVTAEPAPEPVTPTPEPEPVPPVSEDPAALDAQFKNKIADRFGTDAVTPLREYAIDFCADLVDYTFESLIEISVNEGAENGFTAEDMGYIVGAGVEAYCPQYIPEVKAWVDKIQAQQTT